MKEFQFKISREKLEEIKDQLKGEEEIKIKFINEEKEVIAEWKIEYNIEIYETKESEVEEIGAIEKDKSDNEENTNLNDKESKDGSSESEVNKEPENSNNKKRTRENDEPDKQMKKKKKRINKIEKLIEELTTETSAEEVQEIRILRDEEIEEEIKSIKKLVERYCEAEDINRIAVWKWYNYGKDFNVKLVERNNQNNRKDIYDEMIEIMRQQNRRITRETLRKQTQQSINLCEMFDKIGVDKINRIRETTVTTILELTKKERRQIEEHFE